VKDFAIEKVKSLKPEYQFEFAKIMQISSEFD